MINTDLSFNFLFFSQVIHKRLSKKFDNFAKSKVKGIMVLKIILVFDNSKNMTYLYFCFHKKDPFVEKIKTQKGTIDISSLYFFC